MITAFVSGATPRCNQRTKLRITGTARGQDHDMQSVREPELTAHQQGQAAFTRGHMRPDNAGNRALIGNCERCIAQLCSTFDQFLGVGRPTQKSKVTETVQLRIRSCATAW